MNQDFSELIQYLDTKFNGVDTRFDQTASKESVERLTVKVVDIDSHVRDLTDRVVTLEESVHALTTAIDHLAKAVDDLRIEYSAMAMQLSRHEKWIQQLAEKLGLKLAY